VLLTLGPRSGNPKPILVGANTALQGVQKYYDPRSNSSPPQPPAISIDISEVEELKTPMELVSSSTGRCLRLGAATSITALIEGLEAAPMQQEAAWAALAVHLRRVASTPVRNVGTWAGNLAFTRAWPQFASDVAPALAALGTSLTIFGGGKEEQQIKTSEVSVEDYLLDPAALTAEFAIIVDAKIPAPPEGGDVVSVFRCYKTAQRHANSHSIVNAGFMVALNRSTHVCTGARLFFGGLCAHGLMRASATEEAMAGKLVSRGTLLQAFDALDEDLKQKGGVKQDPIHSPAYCVALARANLYRLFLSLLEESGSLPKDYASALLPFATAACRPPLQATQSYSVDKSMAPLGEAVPKLSAILSASGEAVYPSDRGNDAPNALFGAFALTDRVNCKLLSIDPTEALKEPGVVDFLTAADVLRGQTLPYNEKVFCSAGDVIPSDATRVGFVLAKTAAAAHAGALKVRLTWEEGSHSVVITDLEAARKHTAFVGPAEIQATLKQLEQSGGLSRRGVPSQRALFSVERHDGTDEEDVMTAEEGACRAQGRLQVKGVVKTGGQSHFYMEPQTTYAVPCEDGLMELWTGVQDPSGTQLAIASILGVPEHNINVRVRRVGGAFGGKLSRQLPLAAACAIAAAKWGRPVFASNERVADMRMTGGREPITSTYDASFDEDGRLAKLSLQLYMDAGCFLGDCAGDFAMAVMFSDNTAYCPSFTCNGVPYTTHTVHRTSQRAPGVIQSVTSNLVVLEHIATTLGLPFESVQERNFYKVGQKTPFGDTIGSETFNWTMPEVWQKLRQDSDFDARKSAVDLFNSGSRWRKRGIAMTQVKYPMKLGDYNSGSVVNIYADGSVLVSHGGCEIGQGIHTKVAQAAAYVLGVDLQKVRIADTETSKMPNNNATGGSGTSETMVEATKQACQTLMDRLASYLKKYPGDWVSACANARKEGVCLSAEGWFTDTCPVFNYAVYGAAASEVEVDVLTGEVEILRVDIVMDLGKQLSAGIDVGQLEGGFVMSLGYFFTEQVLFNQAGQQLNLGTWEYKIPSYCDVPRELHVSLAPCEANPGGILGSKASAEPPMSLAASAYFAAKFALYAARRELGHGTDFFELPVPCTVQELQQACPLLKETIPFPA